MRNALQRTVSLAAVLLMAAAAVPAAAATPEGIRSDSCVADNANILNRDTETYITNLTVALQESCGAQIGVYTTDYIGNNTMEGFAYEVFQAWGLGDSSQDNGVLLLLATGEDNYWVTPGEGLETAFSGDTLSNLLYDEMESSWVAGDYDTGTRQTVLALAERIADVYGLNMDLAAVAEGRVTADGVEQPSHDASGLAQMLVTVVVLTFVVLLLLALLTAPRHYGGPGRPVGMPLFFFFGPRIPPRPRRPRRPPPPPPPGGFGGFGGFGGPGGFGGGFRPGGGSSHGGGFGRSGGGFRPSGGGFRSGGGSTRGGGAGRR